jgi:L-aspartate oxidase
LRDEDGLHHAEAALGEVPLLDKVRALADVESTNLRTIAQRVVSAALQRTESRGSHRRLDHPDPDDRWRGRIIQRWDGHAVASEFEPLPTGSRA